MLTSSPVTHQNLFCQSKKNKYETVIIIHIYPLLKAQNKTEVPINDHRWMSNNSDSYSHIHWPDLELMKKTRKNNQLTSLCSRHKSTNISVGGRATTTIAISGSSKLCVRIGSPVKQQEVWVKAWGSATSDSTQTQVGYCNLPNTQFQTYTLSKHVCTHTHARTHPAWVIPKAFTTTSVTGKKMRKAEWKKKNCRTHKRGSECTARSCFRRSLRHWILHTFCTLWALHFFSYTSAH